MLNGLKLDSYYVNNAMRSHVGLVHLRGLRRLIPKVFNYRAGKINHISSHIVDVFGRDR